MREILRLIGLIIEFVLCVVIVLALMVIAIVMAVKWFGVIIATIIFGWLVLWGIANIIPVPDEDKLLNREGK